MSLTAPDREIVRQDFTRDLSTVLESLNITKAELLAAIDAVDDWVSANQVSFNSAIPLPARTELTAAQKAKLLSCVALKRFEVM